MQARSRAYVSGFIDERTFQYRPLDRNQRAKLLHTLETFERATKRAGCANGQLGRCTLIVARVLLLKFANATTGRCFPSYDAIQKATGLCRATIAKALMALEDIGALQITRRLRRDRDAVGNLFARQASNLYRFVMLPRLVGVRASTPARSFPGPRVHNIDRNPLQWVFDEVKGANFSPAVHAIDWRDRARAVISR